MIRSSPCELYLKYLLVHPDKYTNETIVAFIREKQLDLPSEGYLDRLRVKMRVPLPFYPLDKGHSRSQVFLMREKLVGFFFPDESAQAAHQLLERPRAKEQIEMATLAGEPALVVAHRLGRLGLRVEAGAVERYCQFYWDLDRLDRAEVNALLRLRVDYMQYRNDGQPMTNDQRLQWSAMKKARYKDGRMIVADTATQPIAALMHSILVGQAPSQFEVSKLLQATMVGAIGNAYEELAVKSPDASNRALNYATSAEKLFGLMSEMGSPDAELQKSLQQLALRTEKADVPHIGELQGEFSVQMEPTGKREVIDVEPE